MLALLNSKRIKLPIFFLGCSTTSSGDGDIDGRGRGDQEERHRPSPPALALAVLCSPPTPSDPSTYVPKKQEGKKKRLPLGLILAAGETRRRRPWIGGSRKLYLILEGLAEEFQRKEIAVVAMLISRYVAGYDPPWSLTQKRSAASSK